MRFNQMSSFALRGLLAPAMGLLCGQPFAHAQADGPATRQVSGVVVQFTDGTSTRFDRSAESEGQNPAGSAQSPGPAPVPAEPPPADPAPPPPGNTPAETPSTPAARSLLGVNLEALKDWSRSRMFIDVMRTSRVFGSPEKPWSGSDKIPLDENGWPKTDAGVVAMTEVIDGNGVYRFFCRGQCVPKAVGNCPATVRNIRYDARTDLTTADVVFNAKPGAESSLFLAFTQTSGGVRNIKLLRPGYSDDFAIFTTEFLRAIQPFGTLRFMDYLRTNDSTIARWDDRCKPADAQWSIKGGPYEIAIALGNRAKKDIWLHVPALADDDFVEKLAELVKTHLDPQLNCYIEYSNELWNSQFDQYRQNLSAAKKEVAGGENTLNDGGRENNTYYWGFRRVGKRTVEIGRIFDRVLGAASPRDRSPRIRMILSGQLVNPKVLEESLEWTERYAGGDVRDHIYGIAVAPYFGNKKDVLTRENLTIDDVCSVLLERVTGGNNRHVQALHALAGKYGVKSVAYEGGVDLGQYNNAVDVKTRAQFDPRAGQAVEQYLNNWFDSGGDVLMYYNLCSRYSRHGYWGLTDEITHTRAPKYDAAARVAQQRRRE